jgi:hypothetical protein
MYGASRLSMPFSEELSENNLKEINHWARRLEIRGPKFGEKLIPVVNFLNTIGFSDEVKGPGNIKW